MKRPILVIALSYIVGIVIGIYTNISIIYIYSLIFLIYLIIRKIYLLKVKTTSNLLKIRKTNFSICKKIFYRGNIKVKFLNKRKKYKKKLKKLKLFSLKRYFRYIKLIINSKIIFIFIITSIISNSIVIIKNKEYEKIYNQNKEIHIKGIIQTNKKETEYMNQYKIKLDHEKEIYYYIYVPKSAEKIFKIGDFVEIIGEYQKPDTRRNYKGFDYSNYLKTIKIYGSIKVEKTEILDNSAKNNNGQHNKNNIINVKSIVRKIQENIINFNYNIKEKIESRTFELFPEKIANIFLGMMLGKTEGIEEDTLESFRISNISHVLAVSGMHMTYLILGSKLLLKNIIGIKYTKIISIFIIIFYMNLTGYTPSIIRAGIMSIISILGFILNKKPDIFTNISIAILFNLIDNPYSIGNIGLQLSYGGTIGIILFNRTISEFLNKKETKHSKYIEYITTRIKEILAVTMSAQIILIPICLFHFNTLGIYFIITNLFVSIVIEPIGLIGFLLILMILFNVFFQEVIAYIISVLTYILLDFTQLIEKLPLAKIYISTPSIIFIIFFYVSIIIIKNIFFCYYKKNLNNTQKRIRNIIAVIKYKYREKLKRKKFLKVVIGIAIFCILVIKVVYIPPLRVFFIDVGQGDSTLIITPKNKTILIDGGGKINKEGEVGTKTLLPYLLDRGITKIDLAIISHFDADHVDGVLTVIQEIDVKNIIIGKQFEKSENYEKFIKIVNEKKININIVEAMQKIDIEKNVYIDILWPSSKNVITENSLNNNSLVLKIVYKNFSILFTGDIEKVAEENILKYYSNNIDKIKATILKVAHHGSKTSSIMEFLQAVKPKIALIGVGKDNSFGHPNKEVLDRIEGLRCKIFRTDENGEIAFKIFKNEEIKLITQNPL